MSDILTEPFKELKLYYLEKNFKDFTTSFGSQKKLCAEIITKICQFEIEERKLRTLEKRVREVKVGRFKPMADFNWSWPKQIDRAGIEDLFELDFVDEKKNVVILGPEGAGKTMIAKNLAHKAALSAKTALFTTASELVIDLKSANAAGIYRSRLRRYLRSSLLVMDELGYLSFDSQAADILFEVISKRYEKNSIIVTTNLAFNNWGEILPGASCISALIGRLTHHCEIFTIDADSYRIKESKENKNKTQKGKNNGSAKKH